MHTYLKTVFNSVITLDATCEEKHICHETEDLCVNTSTVLFTISSVLAVQLLKRNSRITSSFFTYLSVSSTEKGATVSPAPTKIHLKSTFFQCSSRTLYKVIHSCLWFLPVKNKIDHITTSIASKRNFCCSTT